MPENFIQPVTDRQVCFKCHKTVTGKKKLSKCSRCHAITYCSRECQVADWPRHAWNCVPVMVTEFEGKGRGVVAARDIKMGEFIFLDKPAVTLPDHSILDKNKADKFLFRLLKNEYDSILNQVDNLPSEAKLQFYKLADTMPERNKITGMEGMRVEELQVFLKYANGDYHNMRLFLNVILINHSCAPNACVEPRVEGECVVTAVRDIKKGEEVTTFYKNTEDYTYKTFGSNVKERMRVIKDRFGFDCKCCVCTGDVPDQEDIIKELLELHNNLDPETANQSEEKMSIFVHNVDKIVDLNLKLYIGTFEDKIWALMMMARIADKIDDDVRLEKALMQIKKIAEDTKLKNVMQRYEELMGKYYEYTNVENLEFKKIYDVSRK